jgi:hypothetical protein
VERRHLAGIRRAIRGGVSLRSMEGVYKLKMMVAVRLAAEVTALLLLICVPLFSLLHGDLRHASAITRSLCIGMAVVSAMVLPAYGFITYKVQVTDNDLRTFSVFKKQFAIWSDMTTLQLRTSWGWRRYVVETVNGELTFTTWMNELPRLCETIRSRLPNGGSAGIGGGGPGNRVFNLAPSALVIQGLNVLASVAFIAICWLFFANLQGHSSHITQGDRVVILVACLIFTSVLMARIIFYVWAPRRVISDDAGLQVRGFFAEHTYPWSQIKSVHQAMFLLPEGLLIKTERGPFIIGDQLDAFDELQDELARHLPLPPVC